MRRMCAEFKVGFLFSTVLLSFDVVFFPISFFVVVGFFFFFCSFPYVMQLLACRLQEAFYPQSLMTPMIAVTNGRSRDKPSGSGEGQRLVVHRCVVSRNKNHQTQGVGVVGVCEDEGWEKR